jgi:hypothetical protein
VIRIRNDASHTATQGAGTTDISDEARIAIAHGVSRGDPVSELEYLGLPLRHINLLENSKFQITWLEQLVRCRQEELLEIPNFSMNMLSDLLDCLARYHTLDDAKQCAPFGPIEMSK